ncbi:hypothetical protein F5146DRAFT_1003250 [Armillaria mellea]|nr:hypothetical protein F5146DRAFT_1003250 [Armillaria mellea]
MGDDKSAAGANCAEELQVDAALFLDWLKNMPMTFHRLCLSVTETQRLVLEVQTIWAYFSTIRPQFTADEPRLPWQWQNQTLNEYGNKHGNMVIKAKGCKLGFDAPLCNYQFL